MVYSQLIELINKIFKSFNPDKKSDVLLISIQFMSIAKIEEFQLEYFGLLGLEYTPLLFLTAILLIFITFSSLVFWKKLGSKFNLNRNFANLLNAILAFIIIITVSIVNNLIGRLPSNSYVLFDIENSLVFFLVSFFFFLFLLISWEYFKQHKANISIEFPILFLISYLSMLIIISTKELFVWFLALELMSFSFYTLAGYRSKRFFLQTEGSLKYFIIGSIASSLFIFGLSLIYVTFGTVEFNNLVSLFYFSNSQEEWIGYVGLLLILIAISFKLGVAPFHLWLPEVYYSCSSIITFFFLLMPKFSLVYLLLQFSKLNFNFEFTSYFFFIYLLTFLIGTLSSFRQKSIDKFLAYSSIANNAWFLLIIANKGDSTFIWFYLFVYSIITILIYSPIMSLRKSDNTRLINSLRDLLVLKKTNPTLALLFSWAFFSLAGIPPFLGFFSKFFLLLTSIDRGYYFWVIVAIVFSVFSCYYYIRMIKIVYFSNHLKPSYQKPLSLPTALLISVLSFINLFFIFSPKTFLLIFYFIT